MDLVVCSRSSLEFQRFSARWLFWSVLCLCFEVKGGGEGGLNCRIFNSSCSNLHIFMTLNRELSSSFLFKKKVGSIYSIAYSSMIMNSYLS